MRINCPHCGTKTRIASRSDQSATAAHLYCQCLNPACPAGGASIVYTLGYSHTVSRPNRSAGELALAVLRDLPPAELAKITGDLAAILNARDTASA